MVSLSASKSPDARPAIGAALFDIDGTLVDTNDLHAAAWQQAFRQFGIDIDYESIRSQIGKGGDNLLPALIGHDRADALGEEIEEYRSDLFERDFLPRAAAFPGVRPLFERLRADDILILLASSSDRDQIEHYLDLLDCRDLVGDSVSKDDVEHSKPCPDIFAAALGKADPIGPDRAIAIGDTPWDGLSAGRAGLALIGFRCGRFPDQELIEAGAIALYDGPADLLAHYDSSVFARA